MRKVTGLFVYPIKSLGGIALETARVDEEGIRYDRQWMLIDDQNNFISQRQIHQLCLFQVSFLSDGLLVQNGHNSCMIPFEQVSGEPILVTIWDDEVEAKEVSKDISAWFSAQLGISCKLVKHYQRLTRQVDPNYAGDNHFTRFADGYPLLVLGESSMIGLNQKLQEALPINRFRPNLVVSGAEPHEEDSWNMIHAGDTVLDLVKPCARCVVTTIDQATAVAGIEPMATLATYRRQEHKVLFGKNAVVVLAGQIRLGDPVHLVQTP